MALEKNDLTTIRQAGLKALKLSAQPVLSFNPFEGLETVAAELFSGLEKGRVIQPVDTSLMSDPAYLEHLEEAMRAAMEADRNQGYTREDW